MKNVFFFSDFFFLSLLILFQEQSKALGLQNSFQDNGSKHLIPLK